MMALVGGISQIKGHAIRCYKQDITSLLSFGMHKITLGVVIVVSIWGNPVELMKCLCKHR